MPSFNSTCIAWVQTSGCNAFMKHRFSIMSNVALGCTILTLIFLSANVVIRLYRANNQNAMFKTMAPQLLAWALLQIFYHSIRGFSPDNFAIPSELLTLANLMSQSILGCTVLNLIVTWITIHKTATNLRSDSYLSPYWIIVGIFLLLTAVSSGLTGVSATYYYVAMRATLVIWIIYLLICIILLFVYGTHVYIDAAKANSDDHRVRRVRRCVPIMLTSYGTVFVLVLIGFVFYASATTLIEHSKVWPLLIWSGFWTGSIVYVNIQNIYFWTTMPPANSIVPHDTSSSKASRTASSLTLPVSPDLTSY